MDDDLRAALRGVDDVIDQPFDERSLWARGRTRRRRRRAVAAGASIVAVVGTLGAAAALGRDDAGEHPVAVVEPVDTTTNATDPVTSSTDQTTPTSTSSVPTTSSAVPTTAPAPGAATCDGPTGVADYTIGLRSIADLVTHSELTVVVEAIGAETVLSETTPNDTSVVVRLGTRVRVVDEVFGDGAPTEFTAVRTVVGPDRESAIASFECVEGASPRLVTGQRYLIGFTADSTGWSPTVGPYSVVPFVAVDGELVVGSTCPFRSSNFACDGFPYTLQGRRYEEVVDEVVAARGFDDYERAAIATIRCAQAAMPEADFSYDRRADGFIQLTASTPAPGTSSEGEPAPEDQAVADRAAAVLQECEETTGYRDIGRAYGETHDQDPSLGR
jgi:hypothetical protein